MRSLFNGILGLGAQGTARALHIADDFIGPQWKWLSGKATKALKPDGLYVDPNGVVNYSKRYKGVLNDPDFGGHYKRYGSDTFRGTVGDLAGRAYNNSRFMRRWAAKLNRYGTDAVNKAFPGHKNIGRTTSKAMKYTALGGLGGGMLEMPFNMVDGGTDTTAYKMLHGVNSINPFYHFTTSEYSPAIAAFNYATPIGLAFTGVGKGTERVSNGYAAAAEQGARSAIDATSNALSNMSFMDRLGYLFAPGTASARYRSQALDQLARTLGRPLTSTGDTDKDKALADILRTV
jgi:hypothetical protein